MMEPKLWACILHLSTLFNRGIFIDVGANDGSSSLKLTKQFPNRTIFSLEPIETNIRSVHAKMNKNNNVRIIHGGLGQRRGFGEYPANLNDRGAGLGTQTGVLSSYRLQKRSSGHKHLFPIYTVDELVGGRYRLAFGHWDVEGSEADLLRGAERTIRRDRPIFTVESFPFTNSTRHAELMELTEHLGYKCTEVQESCGRPRDCRNFVCVPVEMEATCP